MTEGDAAYLNLAAQLYFKLSAVLDCSLLLSSHAAFNRLSSSLLMQRPAHSSAPYLPLRQTILLISFRRLCRGRRHCLLAFLSLGLLWRAAVAVSFLLLAVTANQHRLLGNDVTKRTKCHAFPSA